MTTTSQNRNLVWVATSVVALALGLMVCANAFAQGAASSPNAQSGQSAQSGQNPQNAAASRTVANTEDMRLWSFGDCDRRFPYFNTPEHKECVRVVGSPEAVEARALRVCDVSHSSDKEEAERCKAAYKANKVKAAADGVVANAPATPQAPPSEEMMRRVKAITHAAVEAERAAAKATEVPVPKEDDFVPYAAGPESSWTGTVMTVVLLAVGIGLGVNLFRRRQGQSA
jgi:hypothetical protein